MRYSAIVGELFYNIRLLPGVADMVDVHFTAAAHHMLILPEVFSTEERVFHIARHRAHLKEMLSYIFSHGDFSSAKDESGRNLQLKESWNPELSFTLPDPRMFNSMSPDPTLEAGQEHPSDSYLKILDLSSTNNAQTRAQHAGRYGTTAQMRRIQ